MKTTFLMLPSARQSRELLKIMVNSTFTPFRRKIMHVWRSGVFARALERNRSLIKMV